MKNPLESFVFILLVTMIFSLCVYGEEENIALKAQVEVSSMYNNSYVGQNAIDGNKDQNDAKTRWLSGKEGAPGKESAPPHWLILDFGKSMRITKVNLYFYTNWAPVEYVIQYEKASQWIDIPETQVRKGGRADITKHFDINPSVIAKRLRFYCTDGSSYDATWGNIVRLSEIEVFSIGQAAVEKGNGLTYTWGNIKFQERK